MFDKAKMNMVDHMVSWVSPQTGLKRLYARHMLAMHGGHTGARRDRRQTKNWQAMGGSADNATLPDLQELRNRSRDLVRNAPIATGAINTVVTNTIGVGLKLQSRIDRDILKGVLGDKEEDFAAFERHAERLFNYWANSQDCDASRIQNFCGLQDLAFRSVLEAGDSFVVRRFIERPGKMFATALQVVEADRVINPGFQKDKPHFAGGVEMDTYGAPIAYHIRQAHPDDYTNKKRTESVRIPAYGSDGLPIVYHLIPRKRPGQTRTPPYLAPVIESLKQIDKYTEAELMSAVISSMFTIFVRSEDPDGIASMGDNKGVSHDKDFEMGSGAILDLLPHESIEIADPKRPNQAFDGFVLAIMRQVGVALEIPFELLVKHFTASYSAAQAALLEAWKFFKSRRDWTASVFCQPVYEAVITEAVARGYLNAAGFFSDPLIRQAYLGAEWIGPPRGQIDQLKEGRAARERVDLGVSTLAEETAALTGGDWERKHIQRAKEKQMRLDAGLDEPFAGANIDTDDEKDDDKEG
jgi:lambda family phage portal protein